MGKSRQIHIPVGYWGVRRHDARKGSVRGSCLSMKLDDTPQHFACLVDLTTDEMTNNRNGEILVVSVHDLPRRQALEALQ